MKVATLVADRHACESELLPGEPGKFFDFGVKPKILLPFELGIVLGHERQNPHMPWLKGIEVT